MIKSVDKVSKAADNMRPYVERALTDDELRESVKSAYAHARQVYEELFGGRAPVSIAARVAADKDIQDSLRTALDDLRHAADRLQGHDEHRGRNSMLLFVGIALGILFNPVTGPETRRWLRDRLFGGGEELTYGGGDGGPAAA